MIKKKSSCRIYFPIITIIFHVTQNSLSELLCVGGIGDFNCIPAIHSQKEQEKLENCVFI